MPKVPFWVFIIIAALYFTAIRVDTMDIDASQYAEMSREMHQSGDYLHLYDRGIDYLDKPPFLFWVCSASMGIFGVNNFGYKFPSILFAIFAIYATYRLTKLLYDENTARMAALVLATCQGMFLMTNDVRCDTILMSWVITAIWLIKEWELKGQLYYLLLGCGAIAFGMMTKGPIALMVPVFCFASDWALKRKWKNFIKPAYLLGIIVMAILLIPMSIGLYQQFDLHPEKVVNGVKGVSGLRFFYWSQSFGRITGESPWKNGADISFLLMNMLWSFLPWIFLFTPALVINIVQLFRQKFRLQPNQEWISMGGFVLAYLSLGSSKYQLPHYIFVVFPLAAIIVAALLRDLFEGKYKGLYRFIKPFQTVISSLLFVACLLTIVFVFPANWLWVAAWIIALAIWIYIAANKQIKGKLLWTSAAAIILANVFMTNHFYYQLLKYQLGSEAGRYIHAQGIAANNIASYQVDDPLNALPFYAHEVVDRIYDLNNVKSGNYLLTQQQGLDELQQQGHTYDVVNKGDFFKVSELTGTFLNPNTRSKELKQYYLVKIKS